MDRLDRDLLMDDGVIIDMSVMDDEVDEALVACEFIEIDVIPVPDSKQTFDRIEQDLVDACEDSDGEDAYAVERLDEFRELRPNLEFLVQEIPADPDELREWFVKGLKMDIENERSLVAIPVQAYLRGENVRPATIGYSIMYLFDIAVRDRLGLDHREL